LLADILTINDICEYVLPIVLRMLARDHVAQVRQSAVGLVCSYHYCLGRPPYSTVSLIGPYQSDYNFNLLWECCQKSPYKVNFNYKYYAAAEETPIVSQPSRWPESEFVPLIVNTTIWCVCGQVRVCT
jgi:hypothetical protein